MCIASLQDGGGEHDPRRVVRAAQPRPAVAGRAACGGAVLQEEDSLLSVCVCAYVCVRAWLHVRALALAPLVSVPPPWSKFDQFGRGRSNVRTGVERRDMCRRLAHCNSRTGVAASWSLTNFAAGAAGV